MNKEEMFNKFLEVMNNFAQLKAVVAVKDAFLDLRRLRICFYEAVKSHKSLLRYKVGASNSSS